MFIALIGLIHSDNTVLNKFIMIELSGPGDMAKNRFNMTTIRSIQAIKRVVNE